MSQTVSEGSARDQDRTIVTEEKVKQVTSKKHVRVRQQRKRRLKNSTLKSALTVWGWGRESLLAEVTLFLLGKHHSLFLNTRPIHVSPVNFHSAISISHTEQ